METLRIELDGDYAIAIKDLLHRTSRQVQAYYKQFMKPIGKPMLLSEISKSNLLNDYQIDISQVDDSKVTEIFLLNQITEWSFGPVTSETIDKIPERKYNMLQGRLNELYQQVPFPKETG